MEENELSDGRMNKIEEIHTHTHTHVEDKLIYMKRYHRTVVVCVNNIEINDVVTKLYYRQRDRIPYKTMGSLFFPPYFFSYFLLSDYDDS